MGWVSDLRGGIEACIFLFIIEVGSGGGIQRS